MPLTSSLRPRAAAASGLTFTTGTATAATGGAGVGGSTVLTATYTAVTCNNDDDGVQLPAAVAGGVCMIYNVSGPGSASLSKQIDVYARAGDTVNGNVWDGATAPDYSGVIRSRRLGIFTCSVTGAWVSSNGTALYS